MTQIDHIGIATSNLEESVRRWSALLGTEPEGTQDVPSERVRVAFFEVGRRGQEKGAG